MTILQQYALYFIAMAVLTAASAFCSCAEAALFSLQADDRRALRGGNAAQRAAIELLRRPDRLLTAILFWNLVFNFGYFVVGSLIGLHVQGTGRRGEAYAVTGVSLLAMIVLGEMLPKTFGVLQARVLASLLSLPLAALVRALDPAVPAFASANNLLQRVLLPGFKREPYLEISDLERAIELSTADAHLAAREQLALRNIVLLSELSAEELMRPRNQFSSFQPPVALEDLGGAIPPGGYLLVTEPDSEDIASAIALKNLATVPRQRLERFARSVVYVPWCAPVAAVLDELQRHDREVAAIVNEFGETIGIITLDDVFETIFEDDSSRSARLLATASIRPLEEGKWLVTGMTNLRRLSRHFHVPLEPAMSVTVGGLLQERLQRLPEPGDEVLWSGFRFHVVEAGDSRSADTGSLMVELEASPGQGPLP
ncbi:MAG TPA: CNNM domain-containing protein [Lacipirellulaceae bacterium]|nr:CNNM domain-containing protein [Lacipirellulaceae bacterium]